MELERLPRSSTYMSASIDPERLRQAQNIFGDGDEHMAETLQKSDNNRAQASSSNQLEEMFNADEIDDPFSTQLDKQIAENDIPERLSVKLAGRFDASEEELKAESEWILDALTDPEGQFGSSFSALNS